MALYIGTSFVTNKQNYIHSSFEQTTNNFPSFVNSYRHPSLAANDKFGYSVAVGSGRIVVGAPGDDLGALIDAGSAHIYDINGNYVGIVTNPNAKTLPAGTSAVADNFGCSVAVGSGKIVVGCYGDKIIDQVSGDGSARIFDINGKYVGILTHPSASRDDRFGWSVAVGCGRIVVGAPGDDLSVSLPDTGSAHIFDLDRNYVGIITHPNAAAVDNFGYSVAVGSGRIVVGAPTDDLGALTDAGSAHIYDLNGNYVGIVTNPNAASSSFFGRSVAVGCGRIVVGAPLENGSVGYAYIYDINGNYVGIITHPNGATADNFGYSVAVGSGRIVVGAPGDDLGPPQAVQIANIGSALIYDLNGNYVGIITDSNAAANDNFGYSVAVGSGRIVVGAPYVDLGGSADAGSTFLWKMSKNIDTYYEEIIDNYKY